MVCYIIILKHFEITGISVQKCDNCFCGGGGFPTHGNIDKCSNKHGNGCEHSSTAGGNFSPPLVHLLMAAS